MNLNEIEVKYPQRHCHYFIKNVKFHQILDLSKAPKAIYNFRDSIHSLNDNEQNIHLGQRKLLLSEIQFLYKCLKHYTTDATVIYAGAAIGTHILSLTILFPNIKFILFDSSPFHKDLYHQKNIEIHNKYLDTTTLKTMRNRLSKTTVLLISDIRQNDKSFENGVKNDMKIQMNWVKNLDPYASLLKFRLPYTMKHGEHMEYIKGDLYFGVWAPPMSGETRLFIQNINNHKTKQYSFKDYEQSLFYHNKYTRRYCDAKFHTYKSSLKEYCPCFDCRIELEILNKYIEFRNYDITLRKLVTIINKHCKHIPFKNTEPLMTIFDPHV